MESPDKEQPTIESSKESAKDEEPTQVKLAVKFSVEGKGEQLPYLGIFFLKQPLEKNIEVICDNWELKNPENYALQFSDEPCHYVTEENRSRIKAGTVLLLVWSPSKIAERLLEILKESTSGAKLSVVKRLANLSSDSTFVEKFLSLEGMTFVTTYVKNEKVNPELLPDMLTSFLNLMEHSSMSWDDLQTVFIANVVSFLNPKSIVHKESYNGRIVQSSLSILQNIVLNSETHFEYVEKQIVIANLLHHISASKDMMTERSVLALIIALFQKASAQKKKYWFRTLSTRQNRIILLDNIQRVTDSKDTDMAHQLYVLQQLMLNHYEERMNSSIDPNDQTATHFIKELRLMVFGAEEENSKDVTLRRSNYQQKYKELGFKNLINPAEDFTETPPGMLALDNMIYFARNHSSQYAKIVLDHCYRPDSEACPFGSACIQLTKQLCEILKIGDTPSDKGQRYYPMLFSHDHAFEELFVICIILLNKTWKEMKAIAEDFSKVMRVVRDQIMLTLKQRPSTLDQFRSQINCLSYSKIAERWQRDRLLMAEKEMQAPPIQELRKRLEPEILDLIQEQRFGYLMQGTRFKYSPGAKGKDKFRYFRLSPNHKFLHFVECDEKSVPTIEELGEKISIASLQDILTGKDRPHVKDKTIKKGSSHLAFSLILDESLETSTYDLIAPTERDYNYWIDGINALLRRDMPSEDKGREMERLLDMEVKLHILDIEGVSIPNEAPAIPPPPPNYDFYCERKDKCTDS